MLRSPELYEDGRRRDVGGTRNFSARSGSALRKRQAITYSEFTCEFRLSPSSRDVSSNYGQKSDFESRVTGMTLCPVDEI